MGEPCGLAPQGSFFVLPRTIVHLYPCGMTIVQRVKRWVQGDHLDHQEGVTLYGITGGPYPYTHFAPYISAPFLPDGLEKQLIEIFKHYLDNHQCEAEGTARHVAAPIITLEKEPDPKEVISLRNKGRMLLKMQANLHAQLDIVTTDEERYDLADQIMSDVIPKTDRVYNGIRQFEQTGEIPSVAVPDDLKAKLIDLINKKNSIASRISRIKGKLKGDLSEDAKKKYEKELLEKQHLLSDIEIELR